MTKSRAAVPMNALAAAFVLLWLALPGIAGAATRIRDLASRPGDVPRRLVGYGLVTGLDGSGDRSYGGPNAATPSVRSVINLLRRFQIEVPPDRMRLRNVAAVLVTAEVSPYLRTGGRFEVQVSALGDATSLRGGVLWMTPLVTDPNQPPVATAQGPVYVASDDDTRAVYVRGGNAGRIPQGGVLEVDPPPVPAPALRLQLREPDLGAAQQVARAIRTAYGDSAARIEDPGAVALNPPAGSTETVNEFLAAVDTLWVETTMPSRVVIDRRDGTVVAGGDVRIGNAVVRHRGITLEIGGAGAPPSTGMVRVDREASVEDVAAGLHAAGADSSDLVAIFEALQAAGALRAQVVVR
jgi:flagellar P-ring protein precursor FlgI